MAAIPFTGRRGVKRRLIGFSVAWDSKIPGKSPKRPLKVKDLSGVFKTLGEVAGEAEAR
jgi:hypothetical protein